MQKETKILAVLTIWALCSSSLAGELHVPGQYPTIQAGIDAASEGDTVIVADGTYTGPGNRDIDFLGKAITVRSESGPQNCIIDCNGTEAEPHRGFRFGNNEDANSVVDGFTIINGYAPDEFFRDGWHSIGGAIFCSSSSPTVNNCVATDNTARLGAGIYSEYSTSTFNNCTVSMNHGTSYLGGGGIMCSNSTINNCTVNGNDGWGISGGKVITNCTVSYNKGVGISSGWGNPTISNCTISFNKGEEYGGGISLRDSNATITDCNISHNTNPEWEVAGIYLWWYSSATIARCTITGNSAFFRSGAIHCEEYSKATITDCVITGNGAEYGASGIVCDRSEATVTNCIISSNLGSGVGVYEYSKAVINNCQIYMNDRTGISGSFSNATIMNCMFSGNMAGGILWYRGRGTTTIANCTITGNTPGGGISSWDSELNITNCILWDNRPEQILSESSGLYVTYSDVDNGWPGQGNIDADPCFLDPGYWDVNDVWVEGDYHLWEDSPCIDTGDPNYIPEPNETDLDGNPRIVNDRIDMGAYEYIPPVEVAMHLAPQTLNCRSKGKYIKAHITLPEGFFAEDVDVNEPAIAEPMSVESESIKVLGNKNGPVKIEITFDRAEVCAALDSGPIELTVVGSLRSGRDFYGTDTIRIISR